MEVPVPGTARRTVAEMSAGETGVVVESRIDAADAAMLRAMGLADGVKVRICRAGEPCIVAVGTGCACSGAVGGCRIGLSRRLAEHILVAVNGR